MADFVIHHHKMEIEKLIYKPTAIQLNSLEKYNTNQRNYFRDQELRRKEKSTENCQNLQTPQIWPLWQEESNRWKKAITNSVPVWHKKIWRAGVYLKPEFTCVAIYVEKRLSTSN